MNAAKIYVNMYGGDSASNSRGSGSGSGSNDSANTHCNSPVSICSHLSTKKSTTASSEFPAKSIAQTSSLCSPISKFFAAYVMKKDTPFSSD